MMLRKIRSLVFNSDYFGIYDNALSKKECEILINQFEKSPHTEGMLNYNGVPRVDHSQKKSIELIGPKFSECDVISNTIKHSLTSCMEKYKEKYPSLGYGGEYMLDNAYNFQKYETEDDGYKGWHYEQGPGEALERILAWMFYLNDAKSGTEFMSYPTIRAKRGRCVIWPAGFTHVHRGEFNKGIKYIVTGWISCEWSK